jgi:hypothetical protein
MDLSDLLIFKTVAEEGGILRAARKLPPRAVERDNQDQTA